MNIGPQIYIAKLSAWVFVFLLMTLSWGCMNRGQVSVDNEPEPVNINPDSISATDSIKLAFDYSTNGKKFQMTFLEFGSVGCRECKKMEMVLDSVREAYGNQVQVVFFHVRNNRKMTKHFGIEMIPVQVLLDNAGQECYRHIGYLPYFQLEQEIIKYGKL